MQRYFAITITIILLCCEYLVIVPDMIRGVYSIIKDTSSQLQILISLKVSITASLQYSHPESQHLKNPRCDVYIEILVLPLKYYFYHNDSTRFEASFEV